jgi:uncharacterized protein (DUF2237 family)
MIDKIMCFFIITIVALEGLLQSKIIKLPNENFMTGGNNTKNILNTKLVTCCDIPNKITGFYRDGYCSTGPTDYGTHIVCAIVDDKFLKFTKSRGNDLITPYPPSFPGLKAGDKWCLCIKRWIEAYEAGYAPKIVAEATNELATKYISKEILLKYAV